MNDGLDSSFRIYVDPTNTQQQGENNMDEHEDDIEAGHIGNDPNGGDTFEKEVENVRDDIKNVEKLYDILEQSNDLVKNAQSAKDMKQVGAQLSMDLDRLLKLAKQISRKFDGLVRANAAQRRPGSVEEDQNRAAMISELGENLNHSMRSFQGLRAQMEANHRQLIESRYFAITREKATAEAIDHLIASEVPASSLHEALQEHGRGPVMDAVAEIEERRDTMMEMRRSLITLHQILLGIARPLAVDPQGGGLARAAGGGPPSPVEPLAPQSLPLPLPPPPSSAQGGGKGGTNGGLNDYEKETRKLAYIAIAIALIVNISVVIALLHFENALETGDKTHS